MKKSINIWMQMLGFERNDADRGAKRYIDHIGFTPDSVCALLFHSDFVNLHRGMDEEYELFADNCAYHGIPRNKERERQPWTNYDLRLLIKELKKQGVDFYAGIMGSYTDNMSHHEFMSDHPELRSFKLENERSLCCLKRFKDGTYYEDYFVEKLVKTLCDYDCAGVHLSDAFCPSNRLFVSDWSWDMADQFITYSGVTLPESVMATKDDDSLKARNIRHDYIWANLRRELIDFYEWRWERFFKKVCDAVHAVGKQVWVLGMYCTDPFETRYMYGFDTKRVMDAGVDCITANILPTGVKMNDPNACDFFHRIHTELPLLRAQVGDKKVVSMVGIQDASEEWSVLDHDPSRLERDIFTMTSHRRFDKNGCDNSADGLFLCLGDGISKTGWDFLNSRFAKGFEADVEHSYSPVILWSDAASDRIIDEYIKNRRTSPIKQCWELFKSGAVFGGAVRTDNLDYFDGCLFVPNFDLLSDAEKNDLVSRKVDFVGTVPADYDISDLNPAFEVVDNFSGYAMKAFICGAEPSEETKAKISELVSADDGIPSRADEPESECDPLRRELPYQKLSQGFTDAVRELLISLMQKNFPVKFTNPTLAFRLKNGNDVLYIYNPDERHYTHAIVEYDCNVTAKMSSFYPVLPPRYIQEKNTAFSFDYNKVHEKRNKFQVKLAPTGLAIVNVERK